MKRFAFAAAAAFAGLLSSNAFAGERIAVGVQAGTLGVGADVQVKVWGPLALRAGGHFFDFSLDATYDGVRYDADFNLTNAFLAADIHPLNTGFFVSAGAVIGADHFALNGTLADPVEIGDIVYDPAELGALDGRVDVNDVSPFVGLGFDNALTNISPVSMSLMVGAAFTGEPDVALDAVGGLLEGDPTLLAELAREEENLQDDIDGYKVYPIARIGVSVSF